MTNGRLIIGDRVNGRAIRILGCVIAILIFAATAGPVITWIF
jgi:hypothetical protein